MSRICQQAAERRRSFCALMDVSPTATRDLPNVFLIIALRHRLRSSTML